MKTTLLFKGWKKRGTLLNQKNCVTITSSVRVPVTAANREYLRAVRQAELDAWRNAPGGTLCVNHQGRIA